MALHQKVANILAVLEGLDVIEIVGAYYAGFDNTAPPKVLKNAMDELEAAYAEPTEGEVIAGTLRKKAVNHLNASTMIWIAEAIEGGTL